MDCSPSSQLSQTPDIIDKRFTHSVADVEKKVIEAKLDRKQLLRPVQTVFFSDNGLKDYKLLELNKNILSQIQNNQQLVIKGEDNENIVLCTNEKTYAVKEAETSNSLILLPSLKYFSSLQSDNDCEVLSQNEPILIKEEIVAIKYDYLELEPTFPRTLKLHKLVDCSKYTGPENEYLVDQAKLFTHEKLLGKIQCSENEFKLALRQYKVITVNGFLRILEFDYLFRVLSQMLDLINENSWALNEINKDVTIESLDQIVPPEIVEGVFNLFVTEDHVNDGVTLYKYNELEVCRCIAQALLKNADKILFEDFMVAWNESLPEGMVATSDMLAGMAVVDDDSRQKCVFLLLEEDLPENLSERFRDLFYLKKRWTKELITPYLKRFSTDDVGVSSILSDYCRSYGESGIRYYTTKFG